MSWFDSFNPMKLAADAFNTWSNNRAKIKEAKINAKVARYNAEAERSMAMVKGEINWDVEAQRQSQYSLKDEYLLILLSLPFIGCFVPGLQDYVQKGWEYVGKAPLWYQVSFIGIIAASFGLRWLFKGKIPNARLLNKVG